MSGVLCFWLTCSQSGGCLRGSLSAVDVPFRSKQAPVIDLLQPFSVQVISAQPVAASTVHQGGGALCGCNGVRWGARGGRQA